MAQENIQIEIKPENPREGHMLLRAFVGGEEAGSFHFYCANTILGTIEYKSSLKILKAFRRKGVGKALIDSAVGQYLPELSKNHISGVTHLVELTASARIRPKLQSHLISLGYRPRTILKEDYLARDYPNPSPKKTSLFKRILNWKK